MLLELTIRNFAIIDELDLRFGPGFSVLTGETGAGKSIIIDGLNLLLGSRADNTMVRAGAERAQVEGVFRLLAGDDSIHAWLEQQQLHGEHVDRLMISREVRASGRSISRVNGVVVNLALLRKIITGLVDIHGQSEHLSLTRVREHVNLLDRYGRLEEDRAEVANLVRQLGTIRAELKRLRRDERELARRVDLLTYQIEEIRNAGLRPGEDSALQEERTRLANAQQLAELADEAVAYLENQAEAVPAVRDLMGTVSLSLAALARIDTSRTALREMAEQVCFQVDELIDELRRYREQIESNPRRLADLEERVELIRQLKRKYGDSIEDVQAFCERAADELDDIDHSEERIAVLEEEETRLLHAIGKAGMALSARRHAAAAELATAVERELGELRMTGARLGIDIRHRPNSAGAFITPRDDTPGSELAVERLAFDATGLDLIEFLISPNPGEPLKPMVKIASGGETSRLMLAIKTVLSLADRIPTLVFDEIDQGIGGRVGQIVGQKLWNLSGGQSGERQVICITHLPQLAGYADTHFQVRKQIVKGRTITRVRRLDTLDERVSELAQMLGEETPATRGSSREILDQVRQFK
jgi:DNA repair protein RecN (Recombination protein N)